MPPPSASQKPAPAPGGGPAPAKKDSKGGPSPMLAIIGAAMILFGGGYAAYKIVTKPPEKKVIRKH